MWAQVATEDVVYMLNGMGIDTGVDLSRVVEAGEWVVGRLGRQNASKAALATLRRQRQGSTLCSTAGATLSLGGLGAAASAAAVPREGASTSGTDSISPASSWLAGRLIFP